MSLQTNNCTLTVLDRVDSIGLAVSCIISIVINLFFEAITPSSTQRRVSYPRRPSSLSSSFPQRNVLRYKKYASAYKWSLVQQPVDVYVVRPTVIFFVSLLRSDIFRLAA